MLIGVFVIDETRSELGQHSKGEFLDKYLINS